MPDPINLTIGDETIALPPILTFSQLEQCWGAIAAADNASDLIQATTARLTLVSILLKDSRPDLDVKTLKAKMSPSLARMRDLGDTVFNLLVSSGVIEPKAPGAGEATPPAAAA